MERPQRKKMESREAAVRPAVFGSVRRQAKSIVDGLPRCDDLSEWLHKYN